MLYSYCLRYDDGAAPNPYCDVCTLVICKPAIRRVAQPGDWIVGLGSARSPIGDISGQVVYAMRVTKRMTMSGYDTFCRAHLHGKIPKWRSKEFWKKVGDCIYDYSAPGSPRIRPSVHDERNRRIDLGGKYALLSEHFYYFGNHPRPLPEHLRPIIHQTQGHKSRSNAQCADGFVAWIEGVGLEASGIYGDPQLKAEIMADPACGTKCSTRDLMEDKDDDIG
jgi:hypothetical protein